MNRYQPTVSSAILSQVFFAAASFVIVIALTQYLGIENFGRYASLTSVAFLLSGLAQAGGNSLVVRETSRTRGQWVPVHVLTRTALISGGILAVLIVAAAVFTGYGTRPTVLLPLTLLAVSNLALVLISAANRGIGRLKAGQVPELVVRPVLFLLLIGGAVLAGQAAGRVFGPTLIVYLLVVAYATTGLIAAVLLTRGLAARPELPDERPESDWLGSFFRLGLVGWLAVGNAQLLVIVTAALADYSQAGLYRAATQVVLIMGIGFSALESVQAPGYARAYQEGHRERLHDLLQQSCRIGLAISLAVMVLLLLVGHSLLPLLFGEEFAAAYPALCILAGGQLMNALTGNVGLLLISAKQEHKLVYGNVLALVTTLLTAWLLTPRYGALAASAAAAIGVTLRNLLAVWFCYRTLGLLALPYAPLPPPGDAPSRSRECLWPTSPPTP